MNSYRSGVLNGNSRVIIHLDVDCFEVQLWLKELAPEYLEVDEPLVITSPNGVILSVNYTAKSLGVTRGEGSQAIYDAAEICERARRTLLNVVASKRFGKVDTFLPLKASNDILNAISSCPQIQLKLPSITVERHCKDELTIDVTQLIQEFFTSYTNGSVYIPSQRDIDDLNRLKVHPNATYGGRATTVMEGCGNQFTGQALAHRIQQVYRSSTKQYHSDELRLVHGAIVANWIIQHIKQETGFEFSAGVAHSKLIAKLACGRNKPKGITIITDDSLPRLSLSIPFQNLPGFGGKIGQDIRQFFIVERNENVEFIDDLLQATSYGDFNLVDVFGALGFNLNDADEKADELYGKCQFIDDSQVIRKLHPDTINTTLSLKGCRGMDEFTTRISFLSKDMEEKLDYYQKCVGRIAQHLVVKVDLIKHSCGSNFNRHENGNVMSALVLFGVGRNYDSVNESEISQFIWNYIDNNGIIEGEIEKMHLTAQHIIDV